MHSAADVVGDVERRVSQGVLRPGDRLPPVRILAEQVGLAPNTVAAAYRTLQSRGIVIGRGRAGTFVSARPPLSLSTTPSVPDGVLDLSTGNPDPSFFPVVAAAFQDIEPPVLYGAAPVDPALERAAVDWLAADGIHVTDVTPVNGALDGIERVLGAYVRPGDRVVIEDPGYAAVIDLVAALGLIAVPVAVDDRGMLPDRLAAALAHPVGAVVITPRSQNPWGSALDEQRADELRRVLAERPSVLVIEDDHAGRVSGARLRSILDPGRPAWAHVRSVAKELGPDLRFAVVASDETTRHRVVGRQRVGPGWVSHYLQRAVAALLSDADVDARLRVASEAYGERRACLVGRLADAGIPAHGASGLNVWVPVHDEGAVVAAMLDRGFSVRNGSVFRLQTRPGIRVTVAGHPVDVIESVAAALVYVLGADQQSRTG